MVRVQLFQGRQRLFQGLAIQVVLPGEEGEICVLDYHAPMLCTLTEGDVQIDETSFPVRRGLARVDRNTVTIVGE